MQYNFDYYKQMVHMIFSRACDIYDYNRYHATSYYDIVKLDDLIVDNRFLDLPPSAVVDRELAHKLLVVVYEGMEEELAGVQCCGNTYVHYDNITREALGIAWELHHNRGNPYASDIVPACTEPFMRNTLNAILNILA